MVAEQAVAGEAVERTVCQAVRPKATEQCRARLKNLGDVP